MEKCPQPDTLWVRVETDFETCVLLLEQRQKLDVGEVTQQGNGLRALFPTQTLLGKGASFALLPLLRTKRKTRWHEAAGPPIPSCLNEVQLVTSTQAAIPECLAEDQLMRLL